MTGPPAEAPELARIPTDALVVLVGPSGSGKSTWAEAWFRDDQVVSSDRLRALVGTGERDQRAGTDAFAVLDDVVARRLARGLLTIVDSLGYDDDRRTRWVELARTHNRPALAVLFDTPAKDCRARNKARGNPVPSKVVASQLARRDEVAPLLPFEFDAVLAPTPPVVVPTTLHGTAPSPPHAGSLVTNASKSPARSDTFVTRDRGAGADEPGEADRSTGLRFGLHISSFDWPGESSEIGPRLADIAARAEAAGFHSIWVMDHVIQIPQVGREWDPMLEAYTTLGFLAAATERMRLGTLVTGITYRNIAHLAKIVATLDVLSSGRAECGLGAAWFAAEHKAYGWPFPPVGERYELLEDALELLPLMWGPGSPSFEGRRIGTVKATCYPRPIQEHVPILVGGSGPDRTLRLAARHADACNLFGEPDRIRSLVEILHRHCETESRDPTDIRVTQLSDVLVAANPTDLTERVDALRGNATAEAFIEHATAGVVDHHIERFGGLHDAGVDEVMVRLHDVGHPGAVETFATVIDAFADPGRS